MSQCKAIIQYMEKHGSITSREAMEKLGCMRLASRISDLKKSGVRIGSIMETGKNRFGEDSRYSRYFLVKVGEDEVSQHKDN